MAADPPSTKKRSLGARLTGKVGPLPVWAWAAVILGAYLLYSHFHPSTAAASSTTDSTSDTSSTDSNATPVGSSSGNPPASGQGSTVDNMTGDPLSTSIDALTQAVQQEQAFLQGNSGSADYSGQSGINPGSIDLPAIPDNSTPAAPAATPAPAKVAPKPAAAPAPSRYYTYAPGKAPKGQAANQAPAKGPAGTTLHFLTGKGYYYA